MEELLGREFKLWSYTVSHKALIIRSPQKYADMEGYDENHAYNIDIEFDSVGYLDIPTTLDGLQITEILRDIPEKLQHFRSIPHQKIFQIESGNNTYHIVARGYMIGKNTWMFEDRIMNFSLEYDSIIGSSQQL